MRKDYKHNKNDKTVNGNINNNKLIGHLCRLRDGWLILSPVTMLFYMLSWFKIIIKKHFNRVWISARATRSIQEVNYKIFSNKRFCFIILNLILKIFSEYNKVKQWDKNKYCPAYH